ncbi:hypothetical protein J6590_034705 [Homalodisca vitripennis]|nr:hypothetical protein J6590_034705 [Homalodisca vitripennis]
MLSCKRLGSPDVATYICAITRFWNTVTLELQYCRVWIAKCKNGHAKSYEQKYLFMEANVITAV